MTQTKTQLLKTLLQLPNSGQDAELLLHHIVPRMSTGELSLHEVVEGLGTSLTHTNPAERGAGTRLLADLLHTLPADNLTMQELSFLSSFFVDRLKDHHSVIPSVIYAYLALVKQKNIKREDITSLLQGLFRDVHCQSQIQSDRRNVYTFLKYCLVDKLEDVREMGQGFVLGFISAVDGEKDPRNLVLVFTLVPVVVKCFPLGPFTEDMFEVVAAYFPIDFVPPANDPFGISAEDLVLSLRCALSSTPLFAPYCVPLLQEKLDSDVISAKLDSLHTLVSCCEVYSAEDICPHVLALWASIRHEIVEGVNGEVEEAALSALTAMVMALQRGILTQASRDATKELTKSVLRECVGHLTAPEQRLMFPSSNILVALSVADEAAAQAVCEMVLPLLVEQFEARCEETARRNTMTILGKFLNSGAKFPHLIEENGCIWKSAAACWAVFSQGLSCDTPSVKEATVLALTTALPAFNSHFLCLIAQSLTSLLITENNDVLRDSIIQAFVALWKIHPLAISDHILPKLLMVMEQGYCNNSHVSNTQVLETLAILARGRLLISRVLPLIWDWAIDTLSVSSDQCSQHLACVIKILTNVSDSESESYILEEWNGITKVLSLFMAAILSSHAVKSVQVLRCLSHICKILVSKLSDPKPLVESFINVAIKDGEVRAVGELVSKYPEIRSLMSNISSESRPQASYMVYVIEGMMLGARQLSEFDGLQQLLQQLRHLSLCHTDVDRRQTSAILHAVIINKIPVGSTFTQALAQSREELYQILDATNAIEKQKAALQTLTWICKALVTRGSEDQDMWTAKVQKLLCDPNLGLDAAHSFEVILKDHEYALRTDTFANIRLLYKQRYFEGVVTPLVNMFDANEDSSKHNALLALSSLLSSLPYLILNTHIKKLLPVLLQGITSREAVLTESTLCTLASVLKQSIHHAAPYTNTLVSTLVPLTVNHPLTVRMKALECLEALADLPASTVLPYRNDVIRGLRDVLNDKKRVVRRAATGARCTWILVGAPGSVGA
nr:MMS19 nucleotide excision repair protein homolog [Procambarus clarkii]